MEYRRLELVPRLEKKELFKQPEESLKKGSMKEYLMRLKEICPEISETEIQGFKMVKPLFKSLSPEKKIHSRNVSLRIARIFPETNIILAALLHDTRERIPEQFAEMKDTLPPSVVVLINSLTETEENDDESENVPLAHLKSLFPEMDQEIKNQVILIKLADRLDNLQKRLTNGKIPKSYRKKSRELMDYLESEFKPMNALNQDEFLQLKEDLTRLLTSPKELKKEWKKAA